MRRILARVTDDDLRRELDGGWTVAATFAHMVFWDRVSQARWETILGADGAGFVSYPQELVEWVNAAGIPHWRSLAPRDAAVDALAAAERVDALIEHLPAPTVAEARAAGRPGMVDRSAHRRQHLDLIERALG